MIASCQPNFSILATDSYWNGAGGQKADGKRHGQPGQPEHGLLDPGVGAYDSGTPVATDTLADVAMYYYKNDLRQRGPFATNNVPTTKDQGRISTW